MRTNLEKVSLKIDFSIRISVTFGPMLGAMCFKERGKMLHKLLRTITPVTDCPVYYLAQVSPKLLQCNNRRHRLVTLCPKRLFGLSVNPKS